MGSKILVLVATLAVVFAKEVVRRRGRKIARVPTDDSHWEQLASFDIANSTIPVVKYRSKLTGLTIAVARGETPIVNGSVLHYPVHPLCPLSPGTSACPPRHMITMACLTRWNTSYSWAVRTTPTRR